MPGSASNNLQYSICLFAFLRNILIIYPYLNVWRGDLQKPPGLYVEVTAYLQLRTSCIFANILRGSYNNALLLFLFGDHNLNNQISRFSAKKLAVGTVIVIETFFVVRLTFLYAKRSRMKGNDQKYICENSVTLIFERKRYFHLVILDVQVSYKSIQLRAANASIVILCGGQKIKIGN